MKMSDVLLRSTSTTFMYRDFQSRNVMIKDGEPWFIDFQGGRKGPFFYDVASFLWQAKARYPENLRNELLDEYMDALKQYITIDRDTFLSQLRHFVLFRTLQVLGAYGFRGYFEKKTHFPRILVAFLPAQLPFSIYQCPCLISKSSLNSYSDW